MTMDFALATTKRIKDSEKELRRLATLESPIDYNYQGDINPVVNGNMSVNQRVNAIAPTGTPAYGLDQWRGFYNGAGATIALSQQAMPLAETAFALAGEYTPPNFLRWAQTAAGAGATLNQIANLIEDFKLWAGLPVTLSFWAKADINGRSLTSSVGQTATGGQTTTQAFTLTNAWKKYFFNATMGNTITALGAQPCTVVTFQPAPNLMQTIDITNVQLDRGNVAANFKYESFETTLRRCQRYLFKTFPYATAPAQNATVAGAFRTLTLVAGAGVNGTMARQFPVPMRIAPTAPAVTFYNPSAANALPRNVNTATDGTAVGIAGPVSADQIALNITGAAGWAVNQVVDIHLLVTAEI